MDRPDEEGYATTVTLTDRHGNVTTAQAYWVDRGDGWWHIKVPPGDYVGMKFPVQEFPGALPARTGAPPTYLATFRTADVPVAVPMPRKDWPGSLTEAVLLLLSAPAGIIAARMLWPELPLVLHVAIGLGLFGLGAALSFLRWLWRTR